MIANLMFGILLGLGRRRIAHQEADGDDHVVLFGGELVDVLLVVRGLLGLDELGIDSQTPWRPSARRPRPTG